MRTLKLVLALALSGSAFGALGAGFVWSLDASPPVAITAEPAGEAPARAEPVVAAIVGHRAEPAPEPTPVAEPAPEAEGEPSVAPSPAADLVEVPALTRLTGLRAFRRLRALGLVPELRDARGRRVAPWERMYRRVEGQSVAAGERVEPGSTVEVIVAAPPIASGY
ncbi:MAG: hypothetical protein KF729_05725 [Sandaracinaceae bacterium]|nr:hypothetical protein [Sandaracinaceae bacterium]